MCCPASTVTHHTLLCVCVCLCVCIGGWLRVCVCGCVFTLPNSPPLPPTSFPPLRLEAIIKCVCVCVCPLVLDWGYINLGSKVRGQHTGVDYFKQTDSADWVDEGDGRFQRKEKKEERVKTGRKEAHPARLLKWL